MDYALLQRRCQQQQHVYARLHHTLLCFVTCRNFHSSASFPCPSQTYDVYPASSNPLLVSHHTSAPKDVTSVSLLLDNMTQVLSVDHDSNQMRVQTGMFITQLLQEAGKANMSCPLGSVPAFGDLTLGGVLATGAHGSGHLATSSLVSYDAAEVPA